ncbi:MAG: efflux RND transporter periplasmic adaptor subunit [bacterium]
MERPRAMLARFKNWLMEKKIRCVAVGAGVALVAGLLLLFSRYQEELRARVVKVSGTIEGDNVRISFRVGGQITELLTDEGQVVKTGDIVARLDTDELTKIRDEAAASLAAEKHRYKLAALDRVRFDNLYRAGAVSAKDRDDAKTKADSSEADVEQLKARLALAETRLGYAHLASPLNGFILVKSALPGEVVQEGAPVFTAIDLNDIWVTAYINETDLARVKLKQKAYVLTDTFRNKRYPGWVSYISQEAEFTPKYIQTTEERVKLVYRVKVRVDNSSLDLKPGMPADAYISVE